jgi:5'-methylthioadenosine phosphorylase
MRMLGIIGGSGLYDIPELTIVERRQVDTPFGKPSDDLVLGRLHDMEVVFLARHGEVHQYIPTEIPYQANIFALKSVGVTHLLTVSAVGSLREHLPPRTIVLPDQIIDRTVMRPRSFFQEGIVAHVGIADPYCRVFQRHVAASASDAGIAVSQGGSYVCIEGPQFSTKAESHLYRSWGCSIIGMTAMPEARLAREAEICYATMAMVTDFDVWHETEVAVTVDVVLQNLHHNAEAAREILVALARLGLPQQTCACDSALSNAIVTKPAAISAERRAELEVLLSKYLPASS